MAAAWPAADSRDAARVVRFGVEPDDDVERRCAQLARAVSGGALRRVLAAIAGRFVGKRGKAKTNTKGWQRLAYARAGDYGRERLGLSARELYDLAAVDAALAELPQLEAALVSGALPWTKVRLIARAAKPEKQQRWIAYARRVPVAELETQVRAVDAGSIEAGAAEADPEATELRRKRVYYAVPIDTAHRWQFGWRLARRVAGRALDVGACAEQMLAEVLSAIPIDELARKELAREEAAGPSPPRGRTAAERATARCLRRLPDPEREEPGRLPAALPACLKDLVEGLDTADVFELHRRLRRAVALEQRAEAELGPWLERVATGRLYRRRGFAGLDAYARERLGMSPRKARALLRIERAGRLCPALREAYREGQISWVQAQALIPVVLMHPARGAAWVAFARQVPVRRLRDDVDRAVLLAERDPEAFERTGGVPDLEAGDRLQTRAKPTDSEGATTPPEDGLTAARRAWRRGDFTPRGMGRIFFTAPADVARLFRATVCTLQRRLGPRATPGDAIDAILEHCIDEWTRRDPTQRTPRYYRILQRDGWRCRVPGCTSYGNLQVHHKQYRSRGGDEADENLITLCAWHHLRAAHEEGSLRITGREVTRFEMGVRPDAPPLVSYESGPTPPA